MKFVLMLENEKRTNVLCLTNLCVNDKGFDLYICIFWLMSVMGYMKGVYLLSDLVAGVEVGVDIISLLVSVV